MKINWEIKKKIQSHKSWRDVINDKSLMMTCYKNIDKVKKIFNMKNCIENPLDDINKNTYIISKNQKLPSHTLEDFLVQKK